MRRTTLLLAIIFVLMTSTDANAAQMAAERFNEPMIDIQREIRMEKEAGIPFTDDEIYLMGLVCMGEAEGESELGKRLVIDTILNRLYSSKWPDTINSVCYQRGQYMCLHNGRCSKLKVTNYICDLVKEEVLNQTNTEVIYFSSVGYCNGSPLFPEGGHYFSK